MRRFLIGLLFSVATAASAWAGTPYTALSGGAPPAATKLAWRDWYNGYLSTRLGSVPVTQSTTYYFSQAGNDSTGNGTQRNPWKTLAKAQSTATANSAGGFMLLFRRGDVWEESGGLTIAQPNVVVRDWSDASTLNLAAPVFKYPTQKYNSSGWTNTGGNLWQRAETNNIQWVFKTSSPFSPIFVRCASTADVNNTATSTQPAFWYDSTNHILYVNLGGTNPNSLNLEGLVDGSGAIGLYLNNVDKFYCANIRVFGYGFTNSAQAYGFKIANSNYQVAVIDNCESYYGGYHLMGHNDGSNGVSPGGVCIFRNCKVGVSSFTSSASPGVGWISHNALGAQETILQGCEASYGAAPSTSSVSGGWYNPANNVYKAGQVLDVHTSSSDSTYVAGLVIIYGLYIPANSFGFEAGCQPNPLNIPQTTTLEGVRVFINEEMPGRQWCGLMNFGANNCCYINCRYDVKLQYPGITAWQGETCRGWLLNTDLILSNMGTLWSTSASGDHWPRLWHCRLQCYQSLWHEPCTLSAAQLAGTNASPSFFNCVLVQDQYVATGTACVNTLNSATYLGGNAYAYVGRYSNGGGDQGYSADPAAVELGSPQAGDYQPVSGDGLYQGGVAIPGNYVLEYDRQWNRRNTLSSPTIGPLAEMANLTTPAQPTVTYTVLSATSFSASVSGGTAGIIYTLYYRPIGTAGDQNGGSFTGSGTVTVTNLTAGGQYVVYLVGSNNTIYSLPASAAVVLAAIPGTAVNVGPGAVISPKN